MKFACDSCQTKYTIPDEKVRGKVLKIRCKKCGAVITVKEEVATAPEPEIEAPPLEERTRVADLGLLEKLRMSEGQSTAAVMAVAAKDAVSARPPQSEAPTTVKPAVFHEWYAMIGGQQAGPFNHDEFESKVRTEEINERTHVWRDGLADWQRAGELDDLRDFFVPAPSPQAPPPAPPPPQMSPGAGYGPESDEDEIPTRMGPRPDLSTLSNAGLFGDDSSEGAGPIPETPTALGGPAYDEPPSATGGLAPLPNLADLVASDLDQHAADAGSLGSGPVEMGQHPGVHADPFASVPDAPGVKAPVIGEQTKFFMKRAGVTNRNPWWKYAIFVVLVLGFLPALVFALGKAGVGGTITVIDSNGNVKQTALFSYEGLSEKTGLGALLLGQQKATPELVKALTTKTGPKVPKPVVAPKPDDTPDRAPVVAKLSDEEKKKLDAAKAIEGDTAANPFGPIVDDPTKKGNGPTSRQDPKKDAPAVDGKDSLSQEQIMKVVTATTPAFNKCVEEELRHNPNWKGGKVTLALTIKASGVVTAPSIDKKDVDASAVGDCIKTRAKRMVFPRFEGDDQPVEFPLILTNEG